MRTGRMWFLCGLLLAPLAVFADGRYQAVSLPEAGRAGQSGGINAKVLILDTQEGHFWTWSENELLQGKGGERRYGNALIYQGKVRPGKQMGEVIDHENR